MVQGVDAAFDEAEQGVSEVDENLEDYLDQVRSRMKCKRGIAYISLNKDSHVLELPEVRLLQTSSERKCRTNFWGNQHSKMSMELQS